MNQYRVLWEIDVDAETPEEAAQQAFDTMQGIGTTATIFGVHSPEDMSLIKIVDVADLQNE